MRERFIHDHTHAQPLGLTVYLCFASRRLRNFLVQAQVQTDSYCKRMVARIVISRRRNKIDCRAGRMVVDTANFAVRLGLAGGSEVWGN